MFSPDAPDLAALLDRYERPLVRYAQSIVGDLDSARDVVQETFIKFARGGGVLSVECQVSSGSQREPLEDPHGSNGANESTTRHSIPDTRHSPHPAPDTRRLEGWLFTVTRNRALDHIRKHSRIIPMPLPDDRACDAPGPAATLERSDSARSLFRFLDDLTPNQREVIRLKFQNDLSYREIADVTQLSVTNVGFLLHTGLKKLRALISEQPPETLGFAIPEVL